MCNSVFILDRTWVYLVFTQSALDGWLKRCMIVFKSCIQFRSCGSVCWVSVSHPGNSLCADSLSFETSGSFHQGIAFLITPNKNNSIVILWVNRMWTVVTECFDTNKNISYSYWMWMLIRCLRSKIYLTCKLL